jgi:hypothetical protein
VPADRCPRDVPDRPLDVRAGFDTDRDGRGDILLDIDGEDLLVHCDLDGDGFADRVLRIGADGEVVLETPHPPEAPDADGSWCGIDLPG